MFERFLEMLPENRRKVIDMMEIKDRCRFRQCSQQCNKEATTSKNFRNSLEFAAYSEINIHISARYGDLDERDQGFDWYFEKNFSNGKKCMEYVNSKTLKSVWKVELESSTDLPVLALSIFKKVLKSHQNRMERLEILGSLFTTDLNLSNADFGIENLNCLKSLTLSNIGIDQFLPRIRRRLEWLRADDAHLGTHELTYQVRKGLFLPRMKLNNEQFRNLSASKIDIHIGHLTIDDIYNFVKDWQKKSVWDHFESCCWNFENTDNEDSWITFRTELFSRFGLVYCEEENGNVEIKQTGKSAKSAILSSYSLGVQFKVKQE